MAAWSCSCHAVGSLWADGMASATWSWQGLRAGGQTAWNYVPKVEGTPCSPRPSAGPAPSVGASQVPTAPKGPSTQIRVAL